MKNLLLLSAFVLMSSNSLMAQGVDAPPMPADDAKPAPAAEPKKDEPKADDEKKAEVKKSDPEAVKALEASSAKVWTLTTAGISRTSWDMSYTGSMMGQPVEAKTHAGWTKLLEDGKASMKHQEGSKDNPMAGVSLDSFIKTFTLITGGQSAPGPMGDIKDSVVTFGISEVEGEKVIHVEGNAKEDAMAASSFNITLNKEGLVKGMEATDGSMSQTMEYETLDEKVYIKGFTMKMNRQGMDMDMTFNLSNRETFEGFQFAKTISFSMTFMNMPMAFTYTSSNIKINGDATEELLKKAGIAEDKMPKAGATTPPVTGEDKAEEKKTEEKAAEPAKKD